MCVAGWCEKKVEKIVNQLPCCDSCFVVPEESWRVVSPEEFYTRLSGKAEADIARFFWAIISFILRRRSVAA